MRFLRTFLLALAILVGAYAFIAALVDPRGEFGTGKFPRLDLDSRTEKMRLFRAHFGTTARGGLVLGSSRSMKLKPSLLQRYFHCPFFNFSVDSARAEDYYAAYSWTRSLGLHPAVVIIGLDVEALHNEEPPDERLLSNRELLRFAPRLPSQAPHSASPLQRLVGQLRLWRPRFDLSYARDVAASIRLKLNPALADVYFENDGYLVYRRLEKDKAAGTFRLAEKIQDSQQEYLSRFSHMTSLSPWREQCLEALIDSAQADGAAVIVWLTPLHPETAQFISSRSNYSLLLSATRQYVRGLSFRKHVATVDCSSPLLYGGDLVGWYDGAHFDESHAARITARIAAAGGKSGL